MISRTLRVAAALLTLATLCVLLLPFAAHAQVTVVAPTAADTLPPLRQLPTWAKGNLCPQVRDTSLRGFTSTTGMGFRPVTDSGASVPAVRRESWAWMQSGDRLLRAWITVRAYPKTPGIAPTIYCLGYAQRVYASTGKLAGVVAWRWYAPSLRSGAVGEYVEAWTLPATHAERYRFEILSGFARYGAIPVH
ncbi:hypothetical protein [Roseisolibacter agri]|uniref:Uncharacterized protein n=1 Tax=Roseisolibacter agri TaxID=2014610 RepID=A0AA37QE37_9BACT|nr:hypothetical protein [Roseisolibacter agri]GLC25053.1 hypothetical protein rosag_15660 [Roseisolibacter agri]